jgi:hypothetical protein
LWAGTTTEGFATLQAKTYTAGALAASFEGITSGTSAVVYIKSIGAAEPGLLVRGATSQTANLQEWQDSTGAVIAKLDPAGGFTTGTPATTNIKLDATAAGAKLHFGTPATFNNYATVGAYSSVFNIEANARSILATVTNSTTTTTLIVKGAASQTADLQQWQDSAGTVYATISPFGQLSIGSSPTIYSNARISLNTVATTVVGMVIRGVASQTADLQQWQDSAGTVLSKVRSDGTIASTYFDSTAASGTYIQTAASAGISVVARVTGQVTMRILAAASQTANLQEWQNSAGSVQASVGSSGGLLANFYNSSGGQFLLTYSQGGGNLRLLKSTATANAPGTDTGVLYFRDGTTAGTLKLVVRAGTSGAETTILDNIPQ